MTKDYDKIKKQLIEYYQDLLIVQYHDKPKAREIVKANIEEELCNLLEQKVKDAFDVDTAVGVQLDIIGKWVGVERIFKGQRYDNQAWFSLPRYNQETNAFMHGFSTYATFEEEGGFLTYDFILGTKNKLNDNDFRMLIKLKIIRNNVPHSPKPIDDAMYKLFADTLYTVWNEMVYNSNAFTVVGSPTITSDGVVSGFDYTSSKYLKILNTQLQDSNNWEIKLKFTTSEIKTQYLISVDKDDVEFSLGIWSDNNITGYLFCWLAPSIHYNVPTSELTIEANTTYYVRYVVTNGIFTVDVSYDDITYKTCITKTLPSSLIKSPQVIGIGNNVNRNFVGSIDLKHFSITVDGKEVFNGGYNQPMEMTFYYNPKRYGIVKLGQEKNCFPIPTGVKANFVEVKK